MADSLQSIPTAGTTAPFSKPLQAQPAISGCRYFGGAGEGLAAEAAGCAGGAGTPDFRL
jgi:hypothetical protein